MESGKFIGELFHSAIAMKLVHWDTTGIGKHEALDEYYEGISSKLDKFVETYFGAQGRKRIAVPAAALEEPITHLKRIAKLIMDERENYTSDLQNMLDEMLALVHHTLYSLSFKTVQ